MPATPTRPRLEQLRFTSSRTGSHNVDTYLENAEIGNRTLSSLMSDLFDAANNGAFRSDIFGFRTSNGILQFRVGTFLNPNDGWVDLDFRALTGRPEVTFPAGMSTEYPSQTLFVSGPKLYISNTAIQYATEAQLNAGVTNGEITEIFDASTLTTTQLTDAVNDAQTYAGQARDATVNNQDFTDLVAQLDDIAAIANPAANLTALEAFGDSYTANNATNAITGVNTLGNNANAITGLTNLKDSAAGLNNLANSATALSNLQNSATAIDRLGLTETRADAIDALGDATTSAAIDRLNQTDSSSTSTPQDTTADYIDALGTAAMVAKLGTIYDISGNITTLTTRETAIGALGDRTAKIDALYDIRTEIDNLGDADAINDISTVGQLSSTQLAALAGEISPTNNIQTVATDIAAVRTTANAVTNNQLVDKAVSTDLDEILVIGPLLLS